MTDREFADIYASSQIGDGPKRLIGDPELGYIPWWVVSARLGSDDIGDVRADTLAIAYL